MARKIVKPTKAEKKVIKERLKAKYPQMYKKGWGKSKSLLKAYAEQAGGGSLSGLKAAGIDWEKDKPSAQLKRSAKKR